MPVDRKTVTISTYAWRIASLAAIKEGTTLMAVIERALKEKYLRDKGGKAKSLQSKDEG